MEEIVLKLIDKKCLLTLRNGDSYIGIIIKIDMDTITAKLQIHFEIENGKGMIIPVSQIKSISEVE